MFLTSNIDHGLDRKFHTVPGHHDQDELLARGLLDVARESPTSSHPTVTVPFVAVMCKVQPAIGTLYAMATMSSEPILISMAW